jgi:hypothetical protein
VLDLGELAERVASAANDMRSIDVHRGFERVELSYRTLVCLGFADPRGLWLDVDEEGAGSVHGGRFGRPYRRVAGVEASPEEIAKWIDRAVARVEVDEKSPVTAALRSTAGIRQLYRRLMTPERAAWNELEDALAVDDVRQAVPALWGDRNWRPHLVACAATCITGDRFGLDAAWMAFDRYSWAGPQIAATLRLADPDFLRSASLRLESAATCDDVWPRPRATWTLDRKSRGALAAMCGQADEAELQEGAALARTWHDRIASVVL